MHSLHWSSFMYAASADQVDSLDLYHCCCCLKMCGRLDIAGACTSEECRLAVLSYLSVEQHLYACSCVRADC